MSDLVAGADPLAELADAIRREVDAAERDFQSAVQHAIRAGQLLIEAKAQVKHGEWLSWLARNFDQSEDTAAVYMRLARNSERARNLPSIREAVAMLAEPLWDDDVGVTFSEALDRVRGVIAWQQPVTLLLEARARDPRPLSLTEALAIDQMLQRGALLMTVVWSDADDLGVPWPKAAPAS